MHVGRLFRRFFHLQRQSHISEQAGNAAFFLLLSGLPLGVLLLALLAELAVSPDALVQWVLPFVPSVLHSFVGQLLQSLPEERISLLSFSAVTVLWASSKGVYGILSGLDRICGVTETRSSIRRRLVCLLFTALTLLALAAALLLHLFSHTLLDRISLHGTPFHGLLLAVFGNAHLSCILLLSLFFSAVYLVLPDRRCRFRQVLPGAVGAAAAWDVFSYGFSCYVNCFGGYSRLYGRIGVLLLAMLWVYFCLLLLFYGALFNELIRKKDPPA